MKNIRWGIIGCGDVTEIKSGPAFQNIEGSELVAVMRRNGEKAKDYAQRHGVPTWFDDAEKLIHNPDVDAVYVATPPSSHAEYVIRVADAGKPVYVEKPMALNSEECDRMIQACEDAEIPLFVAYYRRCLPSFVKVKELIDSGSIGDIRCVTTQLCLPIAEREKDPQHLHWRVLPEMCGGGLFVDIGCHQLDLLDYLFGPIVSTHGQAANQAHLYPAEDIVCAIFQFETGVLGSGMWCFTVSEESKIDRTEIIGSQGKMTFSLLQPLPVQVETAKGVEAYEFSWPEHVQQPLIQTVVDELRGCGTCPSTGRTGARTSWVMDQILADWRVNSVAL